MSDGVECERSEGRGQAERGIFLRALGSMVLARVLDEKLAALYRAGKIHGGVFLGRGQEALSASVGVQLRRGDVFAPLIRDLAGRLAFGEDILDVLRTYLGSVLGPMRGRDGNVHRGRMVGFVTDDQSSRGDDSGDERGDVCAAVAG
jgi:TPP-dependent pyruvate/acetoin dehydrogenase alpha subunit